MESCSVVGLDLSITGTGIVVMDCDFSVAGYTEINKPKTYLCDIDLFDNLSDRIVDFVASRTKPDKAVFVLMEQYAYGATGHMTRIAELGGITKNKLFRQILPEDNILFCSAGTLKKFATGKGRGDKNIIMREVYKKWGVDYSSDNMIDAYILARMMVHLVCSVPCDFRYETDCVKTVLKSKYNEKVVENHGYEIPKAKERSPKAKEEKGLNKGTLKRKVGLKKKRD